VEVHCEETGDSVGESPVRQNATTGNNTFHALIKPIAGVQRFIMWAVDRMVATLTCATLFSQTIQLWSVSNLQTEEASQALDDTH
jgi:hypothetical protein